MLVTLTGLVGRSSRAPGAHMAISQSGASMESFSGGCVEAAVVAEVLDVLETGHVRPVRFGAGSRYIDIRLPCGGGIDRCSRPIHPALPIIGHGEETLALARLVLAYPADVGVLSPNRSIVDYSRQIGSTADTLLSPRSTDAVMADLFTAIIFLFHNHDWGADLMMKALSTPAYFIGAMRSHSTHALRCEGLRRRGLRQ